jgi:HAD superfamily hydrolase (TIGR01490 family)
LPAVVTSAAFFDLDKTVIAKSSALAFGRPFYRDGLIARSDVLKAAYAQLVFLIAGANEQQMAGIRDYMTKLCTGWRVDQVQQIIAETLHDLIDPYVYAEATALIEEHKSLGRDVVLVSSSGDEMVRPIGEMLGVDDVIATRMVVKDGRYTGDVDFYAAGPNKATAIQELAARRGYRLEDCYAYSDSVTDLPLLETVGHPHAVNPDRALRRLATERDWPVLSFRHPVSLQHRFQALQPVAVPAAVAVGVGALAVIGLLWYGRHRRARAALTRRPADGDGRPSITSYTETLPARIGIARS